MVISPWIRVAGFSKPQSQYEEPPSSAAASKWKTLRNLYKCKSYKIFPKNYIPYHCKYGEEVHKLSSAFSVFPFHNVSMGNCILFEKVGYLNKENSCSEIIII